MKKCIRYITMMLVSFVAVYPSYAAPASRDLFPVATGIGAEVQGSRVNIRSYPDRSASVLMTANHGEIRVIGKNKSWYKVSVNGKEGWIYEDYIKVDRPEYVPYAKVKGEEIIAYGMKFMGTPYVWGGSDLERGVDCSGFTQEVFGAFDIDISRVSYMQATDGPSIKKSQLRTGDLVFFDTSGTNNGQVSHVGIYMGNDQFIHSDSTRGVAISKLSNPYYTRNYVKSVRVLS